MADIEFYSYNDEVWCRFEDGRTERLSEHDIDLVDKLYNIIVVRYKGAFESLEKLYGESKPNIPYYKFVIVRRFIRCNFSKMDSTFIDLESMETKEVVNFEKVECPIRGECPFEGIVCMPAQSSRLTEQQKKIARMLYDGKTKDDIASEMFLSWDTVNNHIRNIFKKLDVHSEADFVRYVNNNKII